MHTMKNNNFFKLAIISLSAIVMIFSGCNIQKKATKNKSISVEQTSSENIIKSAISAQPNFNSMNISKLTMSLDYNGINFNVKGTLRIKTDSVVSLGIQPALGIEMYRLEFFPAKFVVYDKINRKYAEHSYDYIKYNTGIDVDYKAIQSFCSHQLFTLTNSSENQILSKFKVDNVISDTITLLGTDTIDNMVQRYDIYNNRIILTGAQGKYDWVYGITYGDLETNDKISFPTSVNITTNLVNTKFSAKINFEKISFNRDFTISPINMSRYTKTTLSNIISFKK